MFEGKNPIQAPLRVGDILGEFFLAISGGLELDFKTGDVFLVGVDLVGPENRFRPLTDSLAYINDDTSLTAC